MKSLEEIFQSFETGIRSPKAAKPKEYLQSIGLDYNTQRIGFNSGQFHHRETPQIKKHYEVLGLLTKSSAPVREANLEAYTAFGNYGIVFPLLDKAGKIVNFFAVRFALATPTEHYLNSSGLYPSYPSQNTKTLFITPTLMDAASLLQSKALDQREAILALHNGELLTQHTEAIRELKELEEIIMIER